MSPIRGLVDGGYAPGLDRPDVAAVTYLAPDSASWRFDVDRFDDANGRSGRTEPGGTTTPADLGI